MKKHLCCCYSCNKKWFREESDFKRHCPKCKSWDWYWVADGRKINFDRGIKDKINIGSV